MCLLLIDKRTSKRKFGYKVFRKEGDAYYTGLTYDSQRVKFTVGEWTSNPKESIGYTIDNYINYINGFHVCLHKSDAFAIIDDMRNNWHLSESVNKSLVVCRVQTNGTSHSGLINWGEKDGYDFHPEAIVVHDCKIIKELK
jgi:hypothetical protein